MMFDLVRASTTIAMINTDTFTFLSKSLTYNRLTQIQIVDSKELLFYVVGGKYNY